MAETIAEILLRERDVMKNATFTASFKMRRDWRVKVAFWLTLGVLKLGAKLGGWNIVVYSELK